ncbi:hypothetical protein CN692_24305 [Bacillus sp. AFS002410]|uniref:hypothetical protein n=1 Tax=Bacillus sp. AFS002410 TaxID=2033481 RepID=UPI000BF0F3FD|nr:hypothetical protein [Bacillus sp. AFS002410]PEJ48231.1 hypothetical protein CN692_24305 [Bacillus sp. AFS002410]
MQFIFEAEQIRKFKYCPFCKGDILDVYDGDFSGHITCADCDEDLDFLILEEMLKRYPKWIEKQNS